MNYKKFTYIFMSVIFIFVIYNFTVWNVFTKKILSANNGLIAGDLVRMGYITELAKVKKTGITLEKKHIEASSYNGEKIDLITIGDSFSQGAAGGQNNYYQDYIATNSNVSVLNLANFQDRTRSYIETVYLLGNSGFLENSGVKYILLESVERKVVQRFARTVDINISESIENINKFYRFKNLAAEPESNSLLKLPETTFINNGNIKFLLYKVLYNFSDNAFISQVYRTKLKKDLFTTGDKDLLFYTNDLSRIDTNNLENLTSVNDNLNELSNFLEEKGIKLIFMPAVNKYDLYSDYIVDSSYPKDNFFNILDTLEKEYIYVNTKQILLKKLDNGEKDIYHVDDTHWSNKASKAVSLYLKEQLKSND